MSKGADFYDLVVSKGRIIGLGVGTKLTGSALVGARIYLQRAGKAQYAITIERVDEVEENVPPFEPIEIYRLDWAAIRVDMLPGPLHAGATVPIPGLDAPQAICPDVDDSAGDEWDEARQMPPLHSLVFEGDRINTELRTVRSKPNPRWFNIGCGRDTLVKLRLSRSTLLTTSTADWRLVQATLKMPSADYCGTGKSFTMRGEPLVWRNLSGMELYSSPTSFEARWDEHGARCLDTPRAALTENQELAFAFPDIETAIANECSRPPPCANLNPATYDAGDWAISGNVDP